MTVMFLKETSELHATKRASGRLRARRVNLAMQANAVRVELEAGAAAKPEVQAGNHKGEDHHGHPALALTANARTKQQEDTSAKCGL